MSEIFVIGHRNPDTDSICSAIGYAEFKRRTGMPEAVAARCGDTNDRTDFVLNTFGVPAPKFVSDVSLGEQLLLRRLRDELQELFRRHSEGRWPPGSRVLDALDRLAPGVPLWMKLLDIIPPTAAVRRPAILAPLLTAHLCGHGQTVTTELTIELRNLQAFDPEWFGQAHGTVLTLIIAK